MIPVTQSHFALRILGRTRDVRRFLVTTVLATRRLAFARPASRGNPAYLQRAMVKTDDVVRALQGGSWEKLDSAAERGIRLLPRLAGVATDSSSRRQELQRNQERIVRHCFMEALSQPSLLMPESRLGLHSFHPVRRILLAVGLNIGVGDELILFELARRLRGRFPDATVSVQTFTPHLWAAYPGEIECVRVPRNQMYAFAAAKTVLALEGTLVIFAEFHAGAMYKALEDVQGFPRFLYLDTGSRSARVVDQRRGVFRELTAMSAGTVPLALAALCDELGMGPRTRCLARTTEVRVAAAERRSVFVNPFAARDYEVLSPSWWARSLESAASGMPLAVRVFGGVSNETRKFARSVVRRLRGSNVLARVFGNSRTPSIGQTLAQAMRSDVVFGVDSFTSQLGAIGCKARVTVSLGQQWLAWRPPEMCSFLVSHLDEARLVGALVRRVLAEPRACKESPAAAVLELTQAVVASSGGEPEMTRILRLCRQLHAAIACWRRQDRTHLEEFGSEPLPFREAVSIVIGRRCGVGREAHAAAVVRDELRMWLDSNLCRYSGLVARPCSLCRCVVP